MPSHNQIPNTSIENFFDDAGTMSLFGGLNMRVTRKASAESSASTPAAAPGAAGGRASASSSTATAANGVGAGVSSSSSSTGQPGAASAASSGFGFLNAAPAPAAAPADVEAAAPAAAPGAQPNGNETGFSFLGAQPTTADEGDLARHRDAAGDALSIGEASTTAVAPSVASSFSFLHADPEATTPPSSSASVPSVEGGADQSASALAASMAAAADEDLLAPAAFIRPANIKKKRGSRRPGFARQGSEAASETSSLAPSVRDGGEDEGDAVEHDHDDNDNNDDGDVEVDEVEEATNQDLSRQPSRGLHDDEKGQEETVASEPLPKVGGFSFISQSTPDAAPSETPEISSQETSTKPVNPEPTSTRSRASTSTSTAGAASTDSKAEMKGSSDDSDLGELGDLLRAFRRGADQFTKGLARVNERTAKTLEDLDRNAEQSQGLAERVKSLEQEQNEALAAEDFEKADSLQRTMDAVSRSVDEVDSRKLYLNRTLNELRAEKAKVFADQVQSIDIISELLGDCCKKESEKAKTLAADTAAAAEREAAQLDEQEDLLRIDREGIESDLEVAQRELDQINARVDAGTVDLREQRSGWEEKIAVVDEEIEELERQLEIKRQERASLSTSLEEVNNGIQAVRSRYETRLNELDERHANVMSKQKVAESRARAIEEARQALEDRKTSTEAKVASLERSAGEIEAQLTILGKIAGRLRKSHAEESGAESGAGKEDGNEDEAAAAAAKMRKMEDEVHVARQNIDFNARKAQEIESQLVELGQRLFDIESKLPALNEQKRLAVSSRNFKEAGRLNGVIKDISGEKGDVEAETAEAREKLAEIREQMDGKAAHVEELVAAIKDMQDGVNRAMLASLNNKRLALRKTQAEVRASGSVEPNTFGETVLSILRAEASACEEEAKVVSVKICGDDSLAELPPEVEEKMEDEGEEEAEEDADQDTGRASGVGSGKEDAQAQHGNSGDASQDVDGDHDGHAEADPDSDDAENNDDDDDVALQGASADGQEGVDERLAGAGATAAEEHDEEVDQEEEEEEDDGMTIEELEEAINNLESDIADAVEAEDFETAAVLEEEASPLRERLERAKGAQA